MEEGGSRKQVTEIKVIEFKSCMLVRLNVPAAVLLKLCIVEPTPINCFAKPYWFWMTNCGIGIPWRREYQENRLLKSKSLYLSPAF